MHRSMYIYWQCTVHVCCSWSVNFRCILRKTCSALCRCMLGLTTIAGISPGHRKRDNVDFSLDPYMDVVADELVALYQRGWEVLDACTGTTFTCCVKVLRWLSDYRGLQKLFHFKGAPSPFACFQCYTKGFCLPGSPKAIYPGFWRWLASILNGPVAAFAARLKTFARKLHREPGQQAATLEEPPELRTGASYVSGCRRLIVYIKSLRCHSLTSFFSTSARSLFLDLIGVMLLCSGDLMVYYIAYLIYAHGCLMCMNLLCRCQHQDQHQDQHQHQPLLFGGTVFLASK
jgi:hypothetical protein